MNIIIGAGVTGLSFAAFSENNDYLIIELSDSIGGYCKTTKRNGFVWDYSGHFFHFSDKEIEAFIMSNIPSDQLLTISKRTQIRYKDRLIDYPFQKNIHQLPQEEFIDCLYDLFVNQHISYTNFQEMLYAKFGQSIAQKFLIPYNTKLYACDLNTLDVNAMGRFFPYAEKTDIIKNFRLQDNDTYNATFIYPKGGAIEYVNSIASHINPAAIKLNTSIVAINLDKHTVILSNGQTLTYDNLISTIPFPILLQLCSIDHCEQWYSANQVLVFNLGFDSQGNDITNHWIYFPEDKYCFYRVGFYSNILCQNRMSLYVELGFNTKQVIDVDVMLPRVIADLKTAEILSDSQKLIDYETIIMNPAYVHINAHSITDVKEKKHFLAKHDIYSIGRYGSWTYCSIEDNIKEARALAQHISRNGGK